MGLTGKFHTETEIKTPADKFHEVFRCRPHHISNVCPEKIQGVDLHKGEWGSESSVIVWNYVIDGKACFAKEIVETIDHDNNHVRFRVIEGDLMNEYKSFAFVVHALPKGEGSLVKWSLEYEKLHEQVTDPHKILELCINVTKDIDNHFVQP